MNTYYLSIGSNLGDRLLFLQFGIDQLKTSACIQQVSKIYETEAIGFETDQLFLNACLTIESTDNPEQLISKIHHIEESAGRQRYLDNTYHSRPLDIDIIFFNDQAYISDKLIIPHPRFKERKFVLLPLYDLSKNLIDPLSKIPIKTLIETCFDTSKVEQRELTLFI